MKESIIKNKTFQNLLRLFTALAFTLFSAYQIYLSIVIAAGRFTRILSAMMYLFIALASFFLFSKLAAVRIVRTVLLVVGMLTLFIVRLFSLPAVIRLFDISNFSYILYTLVYFFAEIAIIIFLVGYLIIRSSMKKTKRLKIAKILMAIVVALYVLILIMECIMILAYHIYIDIGVRVTLLSRFVYCFAFVGNAISVILPTPDFERKPKSGHYVYSEDVDDEVDLVI